MLLTIIFAIILGTTAAAPAFAQSQTAWAKEIPTPPGIKDLVDRRVEAINLDNALLLKETICPECRNFVTPKTEPFYTYIFEKDLKYQISGEYRISVTEIDPAQPMMMEGMFEYPVRATHAVMVDYEESANKGISLVWYLIQQNDQWYVVLPKPTDAILEKFSQKEGP